MLNRSDLHPYQETAVAHIVDNDAAGLFLDMGLGKTVTALTAIQYLIDCLEVRKVLAIAPKRVAENVWHTEVDNWAHLKGLRVVRVIGSERQRIHALNKDADVYLLSRDNVVWMVGHYGGTSAPFDMLVIDESSSFKNRKAKRFQALRQIRNSFSRVVLLTGTPAPQGLIDLWAQVYLLDGGQRLGKFITHYREDYFRKGYGHFAKWELREDAKQRIFDKIGDICISMEAKDYLDLPKRIDNIVEIVFPEALAKKYKDFERDQILEFLAANGDGVEVTALNAAALTNKLLQFANGAVYDKNMDYHQVHALKLAEAEGIVEGAEGQPVLIAYTYKHDLALLTKKLKKYNPVHIKEKDSVERWNRGEIRVLLMHPASGGHGLNLQAGGHIACWFGQTWSLELYQQFNARLDRQGQTQSVILHHLVAVGTMDEDVLKAQSRKDGEQQALIAAVKSRIAEYTRK